MLKMFLCVCVLAHLEFNGVSHSFALIWRLVLLCHEGIISNYWEMLFIQCLKCVWALRIQWFISLVAFSWIPVSLSLGCFVIKEGIYLYFSKISLLRQPLFSYLIFIQDQLCWGILLFLIGCILDITIRYIWNYCLASMRVEYYLSKKKKIWELNIGVWCSACCFSVWTAFCFCVSASYSASARKFLISCILTWPMYAIEISGYGTYLICIISSLLWIFILLVVTFSCLIKS